MTTITPEGLEAVIQAGILGVSIVISYFLIVSIKKEERGSKE